MEQEKEDIFETDKEGDLIIEEEFELVHKTKDATKDTANYSIRYNKLKEQHLQLSEKTKTYELELEELRAFKTAALEKEKAFVELEERAKSLESTVRKYRYKANGVEDEDAMDLLDIKFKKASAATPELSFDDFLKEHASPIIEKISSVSATSTAQTQTPPAAQTFGTKPASASKIWTESEIRSLKPEEFTKHKADIMAAMRDGRYRR